MLIEHERRVTTEVMNGVSRLLSLQQLTTIPYRPSSKGPVETFHSVEETDERALLTYQYVVDIRERLEKTCKLMSESWT